MKQVKVVFSFPGQRTFITFVYHTVKNGIYKKQKNRRGIAKRERMKVVQFLKLNGGNFCDPAKAISCLTLKLSFKFMSLKGVCVKWTLRFAKLEYF